MKRIISFVQPSGNIALFNNVKIDNAIKVNLSIPDVIISLAIKNTC